MPESQHRNRPRHATPRRRGTPRWVWLLAGLVALLVIGGGALAWSRLSGQQPATTAASTAATGGPSPSSPAATSKAAPATSATTTTTTPATPAPSAAAPIAPSSALARTVVPVMLYHHVSPDANNFIAMTPAAFEHQISWLRDNGFHSISQAEMVAFLNEAKPLPSKPVMITFDDGRSNQLQYAVPILKKYGFTATFFVTRKWVVGGSKAFMTATQVRGLADQGFDIGSHSLTHMPLQNRAGESREAYAKRIHEEVFGSKAFVESVTGKPCLAIAYPAGYYGSKTWLPEICKEAGYKLGYTVDGGVNRYGQRPFLLKRNDTGRGSFASFRSYLPK